MYLRVLCALRGAILLSILLAACTLGACQPEVDYASAKNGATITGPRNASGSAGRTNCAIDGSVTDYDFSSGYAWAFVDTPTVVTLAQPAEIDTIEVIMSDIGMRTYGYRLSVSSDGQNWQQIADMTATPISGWRMYSFDSQQVVQIRLDVTFTSVASNSYHIIEIGAFRLGHGHTTGPLGRAWARHMRLSAIDRARLIGVQPAQEALDDPSFLENVRSATTPILRALSDGRNALFYTEGGRIICAIDDDDNMTPQTIGPDMVNDCIAVDMDGDGTLDRTIDYDDTDGDGEPDTMVQTYGDYNTWGWRPFMVLIRDFDNGPRKLWHVSNYGYQQGNCQWKCDFAGDGYFTMFRHNSREDAWNAIFEAPFCFYDPDNDALPEETVRFTASDTLLHSVRYGINADNDKTIGQLYDYDMSITALGTIAIPEAARTSFNHRSGAETGQYLSWEAARDTARTLDWERALLVWDENDYNVDPREAEHERWEGVLNSSYRSFPQEGGPPCGRANKRYELDADNSGRMQMYYWPADGRLHLYGAEEGTLEVDYDYDERVDMLVEYADTDTDGFFDRRTISYPSSRMQTRQILGPEEYGVASERVSDGDTPQLIPCDYAAVSAVWPNALEERIRANEELFKALGDMAASLNVSFDGLPVDFLRTARATDFPYIDKHRKSREALRYYQDISIELAFARITQNTKNGTPELKRAMRLYDRGLLKRAAQQLRAMQ